MTSFAVEPLRTAFGVGPEWLWTWNGICFGYRRGDSLFTYDGFEFGRFSGTEVYAADGRYLGELTNAADGGRLITNLYKKSRSVRGFVPTFDQAYNRPPNRAGQPLYAGHEDFPSPSQMKSSAF